MLLTNRQTTYLFHKTSGNLSVFPFQMNLLIFQNPYEFVQFFFYVYEKTVSEKNIVA